MIRNKAWSVGLSFALALVFALVFYAFNTPLGPSIGSDNAIYLTMGTAVASGYAPYTEIFDHKGPLLFILQAIPQLLAGGYSTLAVFVQQVLFLFACLIVLARIARMLGAPVFPVQVVYLALICSLTGGGNLTEEYTNLFTLIGVWLILHTFSSRAVPGKRLFGKAALLGAMAALCFLTRANNALVLCAMTLAIALWLILKQEFAALGRCAGGFLLGMAAAALPVCLWLYAHGALSESIYGSILHNMMYAETGGESRLRVLLYGGYGHAAILMAVLTCLGALLCLRRSPALSLSMAAGAAAAGLAAFISHKFYDHYLILGAPLAAVGMGMMLARVQALGKKKAFLFAAAMLAVCCGWIWTKGVQTNAWRLAEREGFEEYAAQAQALYAQVPEEDRDSFMAYRAEPKWYAVTGALPCMRFYFLQEILAQADHAVMDEIVEEFHTDPPKWLVIYYNREFGPPYDSRVSAIFAEQYEFVDARGQYQLLRHREAGRTE